HSLTGWGSRQRSSPTGGRPNGMPLKLRTPSLGAAVDSRMPFAILTRSPANDGWIAMAEIATAQRIDGWYACMVYRLIRIVTPVRREALRVRHGLTAVN